MSEQRYQEGNKRVAELVKPGADDKGWKDYVIADGKAVRGAQA